MPRIDRSALKLLFSVPKESQGKDKNTVDQIENLLKDLESSLRKKILLLDLYIKESLL